MPFWLASTHAYGHGDAILWEVWSRAIYEHGFINVFRTADTNYVGYHYVLWPTSVIYGWISPEYELWTAPIRILIKIPPFVCDLAIAGIIFSIARSLLPATVAGARRDLIAAAAALAYALAPASVYDSMWWSQIDSVVTLCMLASVLLLARGHVAAAWTVLLVGFLLKPQPIVLAPVLAPYTLLKFGPAALVRGALAAGVTGLLILAPFLLHGDARLLGETFHRQFEQFPLDLSQGAWNGWSILDVRGDPHPRDALFSAAGYDVSYFLLSLSLASLATLIAVAYLWRQRDLAGLLTACAAMVFAFYMLPTSTHERYLYPLFAFAAPLLVRAPRFIPAYVALAATFFLNLLAINPPNADTFWQWDRTPFAVGVASANVAMYLAFVAWMLATSLELPRIRVGAPARATTSDAPETLKG